MPAGSDRSAELRPHVDALTEALGASGFTVGEARPIDYGMQLSVGNGASRLTVNVYSGKKGITVVAGGGPAVPIGRAVDEIAARLRAAPPNATAGHPRSLGAMTHTERETAFPPGPWIGSDESGKGDYFGPLVAAAVYVTPAQEAALRAAGVRDSKLLDDAVARRAAAEVRRICAGRDAQMVLAPAEYNVRYAELRARGENLNHLLAQGHVRVIEALLAGGRIPAEPPPAVIADQFADERHVRERLERATRARGLPMPALLQMPRAEANVAVAAASILARDRFLGWLEEASTRYGMVLPKGGSKPEIVEAARRIVAQHGRDELANVAKIHFATTRQVLG
jgi:ribonuclease HIII